jgi:RNA polymerase sigma-70 factor (ECF subfamily)
MIIIKKYSCKQSNLGTITKSNHSNEMTSNTVSLVEMIKARNEKGFNMLYDNYSGAFYNILVKLVGRNDVAEDLLQDVFLKIWKNIHLFDAAKGALFTWMLQITRNTVIDYLRSSANRQHLLNLNNDICSLDLDYISIGFSNAAIVEHKDIRNKASKIDVKYATIIDMIFFYGYTYQQTATILNLPLGTVKTLARKGICILKDACR